MALRTLRQPVELVPRTVQRDALGEVAGHDLAARLVDDLDAAQHAATDGQAGADAKRAQQHDAPQPQLTHGAGEPVQVLDIAADDQYQPARNRQRNAHGMARGAMALFARAHIIEDTTLARTFDLGRHAIEIAGNLATAGIHQQVEAGARLGGALGDDGGEAFRAAGLELLAQSDDLGFQGLDHLVGQKVVGAPGNEADNQRCHHDEGAHVGERQTKRGRAQELSQRRHGSYTRLRARYAAAAWQSPCRSCP